LKQESAFASSGAISWVEYFLLIYNKSIPIFAK